MGEHRVTIRQPEREVMNADVSFDVYEDEAKIGELRISRGGIDWYPRSARKPITLTWTQFRRLLEDA
jgi:hypothetical protein